jgi:hypothetical protein
MFRKRAKIEASELPKEYKYHRSNPAFLKREEKVQYNMEVVQAGSVWGYRVSLWPFRVETYYSETEPKLDHDETFRIVTWQPYVSQKPRGWHHTFSSVLSKRTGYVDLQKGNAWSSHARRHLRKWQKDTQWEVVTPSSEEFIKAYKSTDKDMLLKYMLGGVMEKAKEGHGENCRFFAVVRKGTKELAAGFCCLDIPESSSSLHVTSFILNPYRNSSIGYGLINHWFESLRQRQIRFADFGGFWAPGDPKSWKGFSNFKGQFGTEYINYPRPLTRLAGRPKWLPKWAKFW